MLLGGFLFGLRELGGGGAKGKVVCKVPLEGGARTEGARGSALGARLTGEGPGSATAAIEAPATRRSSVLAKLKAVKLLQR